MTLPAPAAKLIGKNSEIAIGRETAAMVERLFVVDNDPAGLARVRRIGRRLVSQLDGADYPYEFHVVDAPDINAFALPGGFIYVFRGLLQLVPGDDALAFVLAHEIGHVSRRHSMRQFEKNLVLSAGITAILAGTGAGSDYGQAADVIQAIAGLSFTRRDEADADERGIELMASAGYDPRAAVEAMELVKRAGGDPGGPALLRSHPAPDDRIRRLRELGGRIRAAAPRPPAVAPEELRVPDPAPLSPPAGYRPAACPWLPLAPGAAWIYRVERGDVVGRTVLTVAGKLPQAGELYRVELELGRGVRASRLYALEEGRCFTRDGNLSRPGEWRLEARFPEPAAEAVLEMIRVPAGEFACVRVERPGADGKLAAEEWYARGVGLVRSRSPGSGADSVLLAYLPPPP